MTNGDEISFDIIWNDGHEDSLIKLIALKNIFSAQLPKMPKEYLVRLIFDKCHCSIIIIKSNPERLIGGICFRPFHAQNFSEIAFCAITNAEQVKGYGSRLMNQFKEYAKTQNIFNFLTFADNYAIGYFKKQGFTKVACPSNSQWSGFIKEYDGGTLMECKINPDVDYINLRKIIQLQKEFTLSEIKRISNNHKIHKGLKIFQKRRSKKADLIECHKIPGFENVNWCPSKVKDRKSKLTANSHLFAKLGAILKAVKNTKDSWPFLRAVDPAQVVDYYAIIKNPIDLSIITERLNDKYYKSKEDFEADMRLLVENCKIYNAKDSMYYKCAISIESVFNSLIGDV